MPEPVYRALHTALFTASVPLYTALYTALLRHCSRYCIQYCIQTQCIEHCVQHCVQQCMQHSMQCLVRCVQHFSSACIIAPSSPSPSEPARTCPCRHVSNPHFARYAGSSLKLTTVTTGVGTVDVRCILQQSAFSVKTSKIIIQSGQPGHTRRCAYLIPKRHVCSGPAPRRAPTERQKHAVLWGRAIIIIHVNNKSQFGNKIL